ncbi:hypothetical protein [Haloquadratum walsbyi]|jgi:hypothetical protein|uniref:Uncharacterized protein n=1 Tax=Haloquadratum walsbyi J07HQW2 TaxID=1238425 RepID=U1NAQ4_9EURY|nr:hypothetical protein [Haloquadratum walsbyi]ERG93895.1 MAG: hypothetical protein J07HQW2_00329 [Haloquadratum walsbyi J07HQW2]
MSFADIDIQSLGQNPIVHGLLWFVVISCGYLFTDRALISALSTATVGAVFYGGLVHFWNPY